MASILLHSSPPTRETGYGVHTRNLVKYLQQDFDVDIQATVPANADRFHDADVYSADDLERSLDEVGRRADDYDLVLSHGDHWQVSDAVARLHALDTETVLYPIVDVERDGTRPSSGTVEAVEDATLTVAMTKWAYNRLKRVVSTDQLWQIPHGVDTNRYRSTDGDLRDQLGVPDDAMLFGIVAANQGMRKNLPQQMQAFAALSHYENVYLYIHSATTGGYHLTEWRRKLNLPPDRCMFREEVFDGKLPREKMPFLYNSFDVLLNVSRAESWGLPMTEAMACEVPVIAANCSSMTELLGRHPEYTIEDRRFESALHGLLVRRGERRSPNLTDGHRYIPQPDDIVAAMRHYLSHPEAIESHGSEARLFVKQFDWQKVYRSSWRPALESVLE